MYQAIPKSSHDRRIDMSMPKRFETISASRKSYKTLQLTEKMVLIGYILKKKFAFSHSNENKLYEIIFLRCFGFLGPKEMQIKSVKILWHINQFDAEAF